MDINQDEIRRQLHEADKEQRESITGFRDAMHRIFHSNELDADSKGNLMGAPDRRQFLKLGGITVAGAAVIAACGSSSPKSSGTTTGSTAASSPTTAASSPTTAANGGKMDLVLAKTAASLENLAVAVYGVALGTSSAGKLPVAINFDPGVVSAAKLFQMHHMEHAAALNSVLTGAGQPKYTQANPYLFTNVVVPTLPKLTSQAAVVAFALELENLAAGTYAYAASVLSTTKLRQTIMSIGGVESRHATALSLVLDSTGKTAVPRPFTDAAPNQAGSNTGRVPNAAILTS